MKERIFCIDHYIDAEISITNGSKLKVILSHGSNNDMNYSLISKLFESMSKEYSVLRFNFSYVSNRLEKDELTNKREIEACIERMGNENIVLIGKSYGGILSLSIASEGKYDIRKVIVLGYPLHEYKNSKRIFDNEAAIKFNDKTTFIIGDNDPNCELSLFNKLIPNANTKIIENSDHSYRPVDGSGSLDKNEDRVVELVCSELNIL